MFALMWVGVLVAIVALVVVFTLFIVPYVMR
jgi:membrane protein YdbS with pleckstrin-like domain